jgi:hypothetical protein
MNPLTSLTRCARSIAYDYGMRVGKIDVRQNVTLSRESYVYAFQAIDPEVQTIEVLRAGESYARFVCGK